MQGVSEVMLLLCGVLLIVAALSDVFQSVIVPRAVGRAFRLSSFQWRALWWLWPRLSWRLYPVDASAREDFLAMFAPLGLVGMLVLWTIALLVGYGFLFWALRNQIRPVPTTYWQAMYFAGSSFLTIGFGDFVGTSGVTRAISLMAGASGLGVVSVTTAYLFAVFGSFQAREAFVVTVGSRAGSPPSGTGLLAISKYAEIEDDLPAILRDGQRWTAMVMESHLAYPTLAYFRSSHDYESWVGTLGTLLDAATLLMTATAHKTGQAKIMYTVGRHATHDLAKYFRTADASAEPGITRDEFDRAWERLREAGYTMRSRDEAWSSFASLRGTYASNLSTLANHFSIPALQWIGDRSLITTRHMRDQMPAEILKEVVRSQKP